MKKLIPILTLALAAGAAAQDISAVDAWYAKFYAAQDMELAPGFLDRLPIQRATCRDLLATAPGGTPPQPGSLEHRMKLTGDSCQALYKYEKRMRSRPATYAPKSGPSLDADITVISFGD